MASCGDSSPTAVIEGDFIGVWRLISENDIQPFSESETLLTFRDDGTWEISFTLPHQTPTGSPINANGEGTYSVVHTAVRDLLVTIGSDGTEDPLEFSVAENKLTLIDVEGNFRVYDRVE